MTNQVRGYPRIVAKHKDTGEVLWEKDIKNTVSIKIKALAAGLYSYSGTPRLSEHRGPEYKVYVTPFKNSKIARFANIPEKAEEIVKIPYSDKQNMFTVGTLQYGERNPIRSVNDNTGIYAEYKGVFDAPEITREIGGIYLIHSKETSRGQHNTAVIAYTSLDEVFVQDASTVIEVYYKLVAEKNYSGKPARIDMATRETIGVSNSPPNPIDMLDSCTDSLFDILNGVASTSPLNKDVKDGKFNCLQVSYMNPVYEFARYNDFGQRVTLALNNREKCGSISRCAGIFFEMRPAYSKSGAWSIAATSNGGTNLSNQRIQIKNRDIVVYSKSSKNKGAHKPLVDTSNFATGTGAVSAIQKSFIDAFPQMYYIDITKTGNLGIAKAKIHKFPTLGYLGNNYSSPVHRIDHLSLVPTSKNEAIGRNFHTYIEKPLYNHKHSNEYVSAGMRHTMFDGHILISTRRGVLLSSAYIADYEIYDKESTPQLPVESISSIEWDNVAKEIFVGCWKTGLYKIKKSIHDSNPAQISKISGPDCVYAMTSNKAGKIAIVSNRGLEVSTDRGNTWEVTTRQQLNLPHIDADSKLTLINAIAFDFESPDNKAAFIYDNSVHKYTDNNVGCWYSKSGAPGVFGFSTICHSTSSGVRGVYAHGPVAVYAYSNIDDDSAYDILASINAAGKDVSVVHFFNMLPGNMVYAKNGKFCFSNFYNGCVIADFGSTSRGKAIAVEKVADGRKFTMPAYDVLEYGMYPAHFGHNTGPYSFLIGKELNPASCGTSHNKIASYCYSPGFYNADGSKSIKVFTEEYNTYNSSNNFVYASVFPDNRTMISVSTMRVSSNYSLNSDIDMQSVADKLRSTHDMFPASRFTYGETYIASIASEWGKRDTFISEANVKYIEVGGQEEFTIPASGKIEVDGIEIKFENGAGQESFREGEYYNFVSTDGFVHDNASTASIDFDFTYYPVSRNTVSISGAISNSDNAGVKKLYATQSYGMAEETTAGVYRNTGTTHMARTNSVNYAVFGDFKFSIDMSKVDGIARYVLYKTSHGPTYSIYAGKANGKYFVYVSSAQNIDSDNLSLNRATIDQYSCLPSDQITVEWSGKTGEYNLKKNGASVWKSAYAVASGIPMHTIYTTVLGMYIHETTGSIATSTNFEITKDGRKRYDGVSCAPFPQFIYANKNYPVVSIGNEREKTGIYDPLFMNIFSVGGTDKLTIEIDGAPATIIDARVYEFTSGNAKAVGKFLKAHEAGGSGIYPTTLSSGEVLIVRDAGLVFFSEQDIGKQFTIKAKYAIDNGTIGLDEFAEV